MPIKLVYSTGPAGPISISVNELEFAVSQPNISISASGTASSAGFSSPFNLQASFHVAPAYTMAPSRILEVSLIDKPTLTMPGILGSVLQSLVAFISVNVVSPLAQPVSAVLPIIVR